MPATPAVSNVRLVDLDGDKRLDVLGTDMRQGLVFTGLPERRRRPVGRREHSASVARHVHRRGQGRRPGSARRRPRHVLPRGSQKGAAIWLRGLGEGSSAPSGWTDGRASPASTPPTSTATARSIWPSPRSAGARQDRSRSSRTVPTNRRSRFTTHTIDPRTGAIHIIPVDLNRDGRMDFVALLAQEHETVVAYLNRGRDFAFDQKVSTPRRTPIGAPPASSSSTSTGTAISTSSSRTATRSTTAW